MHRYDHGGDVYGADRPALDFSISLNPMGPPPGVLEAARALTEDLRLAMEEHARSAP